MTELLFYPQRETEDPGSWERPPCNCSGSEWKKQFSVPVIRHLLPSLHLLCILNRTLLMNILSITQCNWQFNSLGAGLNPQRKVKLQNTCPWYAALDMATSTVEQVPYKTKAETSEWLRRGGHWAQECNSALDTGCMCWERATTTHEQRHLYSRFCQARDSREAPPRGGFVCTEWDGFQTTGNCKRSSTPLSSTARGSRYSARKRQRLFCAAHSALLWRYPRYKWACTIIHSINTHHWDCQAQFLVPTAPLTLQLLSSYMQELSVKNMDNGLLKGRTVSALHQWSR